MRDEPLEAFPIDGVASLGVAASPGEYDHVDLEKGSTEFCAVSIAIFIGVNIP
jgi:hypothetical protein